MPIESREFTFNVSSPAKLKLGNICGSVVIEPGEDGIIHILAVKHPGRGDAERTKIECLQAEDGSVSISTRFSDPGWSFLFGEQVSDVDSEVKAPHQCSLSINGVSNSLNVKGFEGDFAFKTVSGDITIQSLTGPLNIDSVSGDVSGEILTGACQVKSVSGDINLRDSNLISAKVKTVSGDASLQTELAEGPYNFIFDCCSARDLLEEVFTNRLLAYGGTIGLMAVRQRVNYPWSLLHGLEARIETSCHFDSDDLRVLLSLVEQGLVKIQPLVSHLVPIDRAPEIYELLANHSERLLGVIFDWSATN